MSGLLHRLAARAAGNAWTVRADARLPFGAGQLHEGRAAQDTLEPQGLQGPQAFVAPAPDTSAAMGAAPPMRMQAQVQQRVEPAALHSLAMPPGPASAASTLPASQPALLQPDAAGAAPDDALVASHAGQAPRARAAPRATGLPSSVLPAAADTPQPHAERRAAWSAAREDTLPPVPASHGRDEPAPLLPPLRASASEPAPQLAALRAQSAPQPMANQDTEVHIHIGRIEVTAVHEAPRPRPRARERTPSTSLAAYLAARSQK